MKKIFTLAASALLLAGSMNATNYVVWSGDALTPDEVQIPCSYNHWWNNTAEVVEDAASAEGQALRFRSTDGSAATSCGYIIGEDVFDLNNIVDMDLVFQAKIEGAGSWLIRLTRPDADKNITIPADGQYHEVRFKIREDYPTVVNYWLTGAHEAFVFSPVGNGVNAESALSVYNVHYEAAMATIEAEVTDITTTSAKLTYAVTFTEGYTDTAVTIDGETVPASGSVELTGLTANTEYTRTIVATGKLGGATTTLEKVVRFKTQREAGDQPVWYGETAKDGFYCTYDITYNADKTLTVNMYDLTTEKETPVGDRNFHIFIGGDEWLKLYDDGTGTLTGTTHSTFEEGMSITWEWYLPYAGGVYQEQNIYVVGSENAKPATAPRLTAEAQNITFNSAEIAYTIRNASDFENIVVKLNGEAVEGNPIALTGLTELTNYTYTLTATGQIGGTTYESQPVPVSFKTPSETAIDLVYAGYVKAELKNAFLVGEPESLRRTIRATLPWSVKLTKDGKGLYEIDLSQIENVVGLVPQIWSGNFITLEKNAETGMYQHDFGTVTEGAAVGISHYLAYSGGVLDQPSGYPAWGTELERPALGDPTNFTIEVSNKTVKMNTPFVVEVILADANGYFLPAGAVEYTAEGVTIVNGIGTVDAKGEYTITGTFGSFTASTTFICAMSENSENSVAGLEPYACSEFTVGSPAGLTDGAMNDNIWNCADTEEHYAYFDLGQQMDVETIHITWEGAYATEYRLVFSNTRLGVADGAPARVIPEGTLTMEVNNNGTEAVHHVTNAAGVITPATVQYVGIETTKALNAGWGIKPREIRIFSSPAQSSGVANVSTEAFGVVEYFNLQGVRVENPSNGIYIRREGNKVTKVAIR